MTVFQGFPFSIWQVLNRLKQYARFLTLALTIVSLQTRGIAQLPQVPQAPKREDRS